MNWREQGYFYHPLGPALRAEFGAPVWKLSLDARLGCPHKNPADPTGGCIFCDAGSFSPSRKMGLESISDQIAEGICRLEHRYKAVRFIAYFQPASNTFGPVARLESLYREALAHPQVVGIAIGTRPDCLPDEVLDLLTRLSQETWLALELGLQSIHEKSLRFLNRGHDYPTFLDAVRRITKRGIRFGIHLILGIPGESRADRIATADEIARLRPHSIKLHNLYVVRNTALAKLWQTGTLELPECEEYAEYVVDFLERIPPGIIIERLASDASPEFLLAPDWTAKRHAARNAIDREFRERGTFQGAKFRITK